MFCTVIRRTGASVARSPARRAASGSSTPHAANTAAATEAPGRARDALALRTDDALLIVDPQNDFLPGGSLAVPAGESVIAPLNHYIDVFTRRGLPIFATRDWHPPGHCSFRPQGGPWPPHCIAGSPGAAFADSLALGVGAHIFSKGARREDDVYSAFQDTSLARELAALGVRRVFVGGLATDVCVRATVLDALSAGFAVVVLTDAIRAVDVHPGDGARALAEMRARGAQVHPAQHSP